MEVSLESIRNLREKTQAGIMDCKTALASTNGDFEKAIDYLRQKGLASVTKKTGRIAGEGFIESYIHPGGRIGVLVEVNCETDFVANTQEFKTFVKNIAMQIAASNPLYIRKEDVSKEVLEKEKEIYLAQIKGTGKPEKVMEKIAEGKLEKFYNEVCLLEQSFIREPDTTVKQLLNSLIAKIGENIIIRRFARYQLGEEI